MRDESSADLRDQAIRAALRDASSLGAMVATEFRVSCLGAERAVYVATLAECPIVLAGRLEEVGTGDLVADFWARRITVRFGRGRCLVPRARTDERGEWRHDMGTARID